MQRSLPSIRGAATSGAKRAIKGTLNLGSSSFNKMFPTIGRMMGGMGGSKVEQDKTSTETRRLQSSLNSDLSQNTSRLSVMLDNQNFQNQLLGQLLNSLKVVPTVSPPAPEADGDLGLLPGINRRNARPQQRQQRPAQRPAARPAPSAPRPAAATPRPTTAPTSASGASRPATAVRAGARIAARFLGPLGVVLALKEGLKLLAENSTHLSASKRAQLTRTISSLQSNIDTYRTKLEQLQNEENEQEALKLGRDLEELLTDIRSQRARISQMAAELDADLQRENTRRRKSNSFSFTQAIAQLTGEAAQLSLPAQTAEVAQVIPPPPTVPAPAAPVAPPPVVPPPPAPPAVATPVAAPSLPNFSMPPLPPAPPVATAVPTAALVEQPSLSVQIQGGALTYDFEKITFEADLIKFDGPSNLLQASSQTTPVSQPNISMGATSQPAQVNSGVATSVGSAGSGSGVMPGGAGSTPAQITNNPPTPVGAPGSGSGVMPAGSAAQPSGAPATPITGTTAQILATIRAKESGGNYQAQSRSSTASGAYQFINGTWQSLTRRFNIGTEFARAVEAPPAVQDALAAAYVNDILSKNNNNVAVIPNVWYTGNAQGRMSDAALAANRGLTAETYQRNWLATFAAQGGAVPQAVATQQPSAPSAGPVLAQASTDRVSADRQQVASTQRMATGFNQQQVMQQQPSPAAQQTAAAPSRTGGEVPLKIRILSTFEQLARA